MKKEIVFSAFVMLLVLAVAGIAMADGENFPYGIWNSEGNVGIGTTSPENNLHVNGGMRWAGGAVTPFAYSNIDAGGLYIEQAGSAGNPESERIRLQSAKGGGTCGGISNPNFSQFYLDPTNGFAFLKSGSANGNVGINTANPQNNLHVNGGMTWAGNTETPFAYSNIDVGGLYIEQAGSPNNRESERIRLQSSKGGGTAGLNPNYSQFYLDPTYGFAFLASGTANANVGIGTANPGYHLHVIGDIAYTGSLYDLSDLRLKENILPIENAVGKVSSLNGVYFNYKGQIKEKREVGVIAQDVEQVLPEVVGSDADGFKSVDYSKLTALLIEAVKAQQVQMEALQKRIEELENR
jgi:hypothetical protein